MSTGITSRHFRAFVGSCRKFVPNKYESGPEVLIPSFHPENGERSELSTIDGRTIAIGKSLPRVASTDSPKLFVKVYVLGQPKCCARRIPIRTSRLRHLPRALRRYESFRAAKQSHGQRQIPDRPQGCNSLSIPRSHARRACPP